MVLMRQEDVRIAERKNRGFMGRKTTGVKMENERKNVLRTGLMMMRIFDILLPLGCV